MSRARFFAQSLLAAGAMACGDGAVTSGGAAGQGDIRDIGSLSGLSGAWDTGCTPRNLLTGQLREDDSYRVRIRFIGGGQAEVTFEEWDSTRDCAGPSSLLVETGVLVEGDGQVAFRPSSRKLTFRDDERGHRVAQANQEKWCGISDWASGKAREVIDPPQGSVCGRDRLAGSFEILGFAISSEGGRLFPRAMVTHVTIVRTQDQETRTVTRAAGPVHVSLRETGP